jgi:opacity protein-like surface antigen
VKNPWLPSGVLPHPKSVIGFCKFRFEGESPVTVNKILLLALSLSVLMAAAHAQVPTSGNVFVGYSYLNAGLNSNNRTSLNGWDGSLEGKIFPFVGIVGDFSGHYGSTSIGPNPACTGTVGSTCNPLNAQAHVYSFLFGPRVSFSVGKIRPFAHALIGASHISETTSLFSPSDTSFAYALGGGFDYHLIPLISWRVQADLLQTRFFSNTQNNARISTGIVVHF